MPSSLIRRFGSTFGNAVDKFMTKSGFASLEDDLDKIKNAMTKPASTTSESTTSESTISTFTSCEKPESFDEAMNCGMQKFTTVDGEGPCDYCLNDPSYDTPLAKLQCRTDCKSGFAAVGDALPLPDATEFYGNNRFKQAEGLNWSGGSSNRLRHERWRNSVPSAPNTTLGAPVGTTGTVVPSGLSTFSAEGDAPAEDNSAEMDKQKIKEMEEKTKDYIKKDTSISWNGGSSNRLRKIRWANQPIEPPTSKGPISYQDAILAQPMPVLSPLRGTNQPQGIRAIADANAGYNTQYYDPKYVLQTAIPANISSGSLDYTQKATVAGKTNTNTQQTTGTSSFAAKFM